jgi:hypothetical protein
VLSGDELGHFLAFLFSHHAGRAPKYRPTLELAYPGSSVSFTAKADEEKLLRDVRKTFDEANKSHARYVIAVRKAHEAGVTWRALGDSQESSDEWKSIVEAGLRPFERNQRADQK